jgi:hypothetical protein
MGLPLLKCIYSERWLGKYINEVKAIKVEVKGGYMVGIAQPA